jgi:hypothetical protein
MFWHDFAVIKLNFLFESLNKIGLTKKLDAQLQYLTQANLGRYRRGSCLGFPVRGVLLYQSLKMIKKRTPHGKFSIYPAHPFLICTVQYCPRFHFPEFDGWSKAWSSTRHGAWALENTRRRPPFVPSPCLYDPCIGQHQTAHVRAHKPPPRGGWRHKA